MTILHIITEPLFKADMALAIVDGLRQDHLIDALFYSLEEVPSNTQLSFNSTTVQLIPSRVTSAILHVNYSLYRLYNNKKKAKALIKQLQNIVTQVDVEIITIFHDIPTNKIRSLFIMNPWHNFLTKELANISTSIITNNHFYESHLNELSKTPTASLNHFSRAGELQSNNLLGASRCNLVILGGIERFNIYKNHNLLRQTYDLLKIDQIVDIGTPVDWSSINTKGLKIKKMGLLNQSDTSDQLTISKVGIFDYSKYPRCLGKSSVLNAYKAHGVTPLLFKNVPSNNHDNLLAGINYIAPNQLEILKSDRSIAKIAHANYDSYQTHNRSQWVKLIKTVTYN